MLSFYFCSVEVVIWDDSLAKLEEIFIIVGSIFILLILITICVFCTSLFVSCMASAYHVYNYLSALFPCKCRVALVKWRTRGLSRLQVRALPKRKFHKQKETVETCSICLDEFKEGETIRVLPCEHGELLSWG